jgi:hypothetical protein
MRVNLPQGKGVNRVPTTVLKSHRYRYNLDLTDQTYEQLKELADSSGTTVAELVRRFISLGLIVARVQSDPNAALIIREGDREREVMLV